MVLRFQIALPQDGGGTQSRPRGGQFPRPSAERQRAGESGVEQTGAEAGHRHWQNLLDEANFSCGIRYLPLGATPIVLARYNGGSHIHGDIAYLPHIHAATAEALLAGLRPDAIASATDRYTTLEGALACLLDDYNVGGISAQHDQPGLVP